MPTNQQSEQYQDYLVEAFSTEASKEADKFAVFALAAGAAVWGLSGNAIAGIALGGCILLYSDKGIRASNRALEVIQKNQIAAPFLKGDNFQDFRREFGDTLTLEQLKQAHEYGLPIQAIAEEYLYKQCPELEQQPKALKDTAGILPSLPSSTQTIPQTGEELLNRLQAECPELLLLVKAPPIRLVGLQRTGKSTFARKLALLRAVLIPGHRLLWATPHKEADNPVPAALNPIGTTAQGAKDFAAIEAAWKEIQKQIDQGRSLNLSAVWDEFGRYDEFNDLECLGKSLKSLLQESSKHEYHPILIAHGDQACFYPGVAGLFSTLKQSTVKVETIGARADALGSMQPTGEIEITWLDGSKVRFKLPEWFTVELLLSLQPESTKGKLIEEIDQLLQGNTLPEASTNPPQSTLETLENSYRLNAPEEFITTPQALVKMPSELHRKLAEYLQQKQEYPVRKIVQNWGSDKKLNASDVSGLLADLMQLGLIDTFSPADTNAEWVRWIGSI